jgi:hypothetical protein
MSAQIYSTNLVQFQASEGTNNDIPDWLLIPGFLMSESGIILVALGNWTLLTPITQSLLLLSGTIFCFIGIVLIPSWLIYKTKAASSARKEAL